MGLFSSKSSKSDTPTASGYTPAQQATRADLQARFAATRTATREGREVPKSARRSGRMDG